MKAIDTADASVQTLYFEDDGATPNSRLPVLLYHLQVEPYPDAASAFEALFAAHRWTPLWRGGIFDYHHFHPNAHEALGVASGRARVTLGGASGQTVSVKRGDVLVLPAGTGHCCVESSDDFQVVGAYPHGQEDYDIQRPDSSVHRRMLARIVAVPGPEQDPVRGGLMTCWR
ncbi:cupin domain-containing protein [Pseudomonas xanthosomatis]|uniref:cupin domain-containing protein n=1 Tax=Pseudomonas xanthosomatis TaxID=2842356 RepID=UPI001C3E0321|nr:cupin domain-containing protein [Pseudomonas xanthosomatis]QXH44384.1 cupin domain-containing protein [Pseudomonas xanthosomatis]